MGQDIRTYRAASLQEAIELVREDLGPDASVLHTRKVRASKMPWSRRKHIEVTASSAIEAPRRFTEETNESLQRDKPRPVAVQPIQQTTPDRAHAPAQPPEVAPAEFEATQEDEPLWDMDAYRSRVQSVIARDLRSVSDSLAEDLGGDEEQAIRVATPTAESREATDRFDETQHPDDRQRNATPDAMRVSARLGARGRAWDAQRREAGAHEVGSRSETPANLVGTRRNSAVSAGRDPIGRDAGGLEGQSAQESTPVERDRNDQDQLNEQRPQELRLAETLRQRLVAAEFSESTARRLSSAVKDHLDGDAEIESALRILRSTIEGDLSLSGPIAVGGGRQKVVALVGPTGVGKTTTIAKLAADFRLREHRKVGLITFDTYRIAAVDQLRTYADIIELPMRVVSSLQDIQAATEEMRDMDIVLMDTAGRSPQDDVRIRELRAGLRQARVDEVHLVLSCTSSGRSVRGAVKSFSAVGVDSLILTKLDEAESFGGVFPALGEFDFPISYMTDGQVVPDDIQVASSKRLAERIVQSV